MNKKSKNTAGVSSNSKNGLDTYLILILLTTFFVFIKSLNSDILDFDDNEYFSSYPEILKLSFASIKKYFTSYYVLMYQPLPILSFAVSYSIFKFDPTAHHTINLIIHLFNIYLVYQFIGKLKGIKTIQLIVAFLFALHPLAIEAVLWISCRSSVMYVCFFLLGLISYLNFKETNHRNQIMLCGMWFVLSLFSKVQAVTFPLVLLAIDLFQYKSGLTKKIILEKLPFFTLSVAFGVAALLNSETSDNMAFTASNYSGIDYFFILSYESIWYLYKIFIPLNLSPIYVYPLKVNGYLPFFYYLSTFAVVALVFLVYKTYKKYDYLLFGLAFFYLIIFVVFQIVPSRLFIVADRYGYLPNIGIFYIMACWFWQWNKGDIGWLKQFKEKQWVLYVLGAGFVILSFKQTSVWKNDLTLSNRIIEVNQETGYLGRAYGIRANYLKNVLGMPNEALEDYKKASELDTNDMISRYQTALTYQSLGDTIRAVEYFLKASKAEPASPIPYTDLGAMYSSLNNFKKALVYAEKALRVSKDFPNALVLKAVCVLNLGNAPEAEKILTHCIETNPTFKEAYKNRGIIRINNLNNKNGACADFQKAADLGDESSIQILRDYCN